MNSPACVCILINSYLHTKMHVYPPEKNEQRKVSRTNNTNYYLSWGKLKGAELIEVKNQNSK